MAGQQNIHELTLDQWYSKACIEVKKFVKADYLNEHYKIYSEVDGCELMHWLMVKEVSCADSCPIKNYYHQKMTLCGVDALQIKCEKQC